MLEGSMWRSEKKYDPSQCSYLFCCRSYCRKIGCSYLELIKTEHWVELGQDGNHPSCSCAAYNLVYDHFQVIIQFIYIITNLGICCVWTNLTTYLTSRRSHPLSTVNPSWARSVTKIYPLTDHNIVQPSPASNIADNQIQNEIDRES
jgi:hypothetical protein